MKVKVSERARLRRLVSYVNLFKSGQGSKASRHDPGFDVPSIWYALEPKFGKVGGADNEPA